MAVLEIKTFDDPVLRKKARAVPRVNKTVKKILDDMLETMRMASGVGLAAPQVGISKRIIVVDVGEGPYYLINPEVVTVSSETEVKWEGCLSWPGYIGEVERPLRVSVKGLDRDGHEIWVEGEGLLARALMHEIDHLDGVLFIDKARSIAEVEEEPVEVVKDEEKAITCVFLGSPEFAVPSLEELVNSGFKVPLVITQPARPFGRKKVLKPTPVEETAVKLGLPVMTPESIASDEVIAKLKEIPPDFITVVAYGQKLPKEILDIPKKACLNVHPSLLPRYRGGNPIQRQIMAGEEVTGISVIYMSEKMDAGDIAVQKTLTIAPDETFGTLEKRLAVLGAHSLVEAIFLIYTGSCGRTPQDESKKSYAYFLKPGEDIIDWSWPVKRIHNLVRGLSPSPGAVTFLGEERIKILETKRMEESNMTFKDEPGKVIGLHGDSLLVMCGDGVLGVQQIQPEGKRPMTGKAFYVGRREPLKFGSNFGSSPADEIPT